MSTKIGHFEILSELAKSPTGVVYKANDPESGQTVALKAIQLSAFGETATALEQALLAEAEATKVLSCPNITNVYGAGQIEGQFCAAMEYVQGNSIATMLARKEGFSIWDLLDIGRQLSSGLDYASSNNVVHRSLEPSKIMCGWDGTVKILSFGVSSVGDFVQHAEGVSSILHYMSPEQVRGEAMDGRSNLFSLGAMFYEMVTERKAFDREDVESLRQGILESTPVAPIHVNPKIHPLLSDLIMKALAKDPAERFQNGREMLDELEKCKESKPAAAKKAEAPKGLIAPDKAKAAAPAKPVSAPKPAPARPAAPSAQPARPANPVSAPVAKAPVKPAEKKPAAPAAAAVVRPASAAAPVSKVAVPKAAAAAAGIGSRGDAAIHSREVQEIDLSGHTMESPAEPTIEAAESSSEYMSAAVLDEPEVETFEPQVEDDGPKITVDPMMAEGGPRGSTGTSFSEISELPPLKESYTPPPPPPPPPTDLRPLQSAPAATMFKGGPNVDEKPKVQPREVAEKAIKEIKSVPPKLMLYSLAGAAALIVAIGIGMTIYIHNLGSDDDSGAARSSVPATEAPAPAASQPVAPKPVPQAQETPAPVAQQPDETPEPVAPAEKRGASAKSRNAKKKAAAAPAIILGQLAVDSTPQGAQVQVDGKSDPSWVTPFAMTNVQPGQHSVTISRPGYITDTRTLDVTGGNRSAAMIHLTQLLATLVVKSEPAGASIYVDGKDVGAKTPAQVSVNKGQHVVLVRMSGYIDETMSTQFVLGQTFNFSPTLRALGNVDSIKTVGKMSKLFGGGKGDAGQATLSIHTQPKGAQIAVNQHMLDKNSPVDVMIDPGNYVIDITMTGYAPVHKVITADKKGKVVVDEVLQQQ
jgi:eukaryotic-like serine/threonine-protein kinase